MPEFLDLDLDLKALIAAVTVAPARYVSSVDHQANFRLSALV